jgi:hypothetical protein
MPIADQYAFLMITLRFGYAMPVLTHGSLAFTRTIRSGLEMSGQAAAQFLVLPKPLDSPWSSAIPGLSLSLFVTPPTSNRSG